MPLHFIGKDPSSPNNGSPTVWLDDADGSIVIQGWRIEDAATLAEVTQNGPVPGHETVIRVPHRMAPFLRKACDDGRVSDV